MDNKILPALPKSVVCQKQKTKDENENNKSEDREQQRRNRIMEDYLISISTSLKRKIRLESCPLLRDSTLISRIPRPLPREFQDIYIERHKPLFLRLLTDLYLVAHHYWNPVHVLRSEFIMMDYIGTKICKNLDMMFDDHGKEMLEEVFDLKNEATKNLISTTNYLPLYLIAGTAFICRDEKPYHYKLWMATMRTDPVFHLDAQYLVSLTPYNTHRVKGLPKDLPPARPDEYFMPEVKVEPEEELQPNEPTPTTEEALPEQLEPKKSSTAMANENLKEIQRPVRTTASIADLRGPQAESKPRKTWAQIAQQSSTEKEQTLRKTISMVDFRRLQAGPILQEERVGETMQKNPGGKQQKPPIGRASTANIRQAQAKQNLQGNSNPMEKQLPTPRTSSTASFITQGTTNANEASNPPGRMQAPERASSLRVATSGSDQAKLNAKNAPGPSKAPRPTVNPPPTRSAKQEVPLAKKPETAPFDYFGYQDRVIKTLWDRCDELEELVVPPKKKPMWDREDSDDDEY